MSVSLTLAPARHPSSAIPALPTPISFAPANTHQGAGPSGLVAAKSLLHDAPAGTFDVTLFDSQTRLGGLWPAHGNDATGLVHPRMVANQSKHTVQFSDLAWPDDAPELPRAWQVGQYLARYHQAYCSGATLRLGTRVERAEPLQADANHGREAGWVVQTCSPEGEMQQEQFDYLLVASGFFGKPFLPSVSEGDHKVPIIHSSQYRDLPGLLGKGDFTGSKILVVGGQMSGVEIAGTIASHLSSATHSPSPSLVPNPDKYTIEHLIQQPVWVFPLHTSPKVSAHLESAPIIPPLTTHSPKHPHRPFCHWTWGHTTSPTGSIL